MDGHTLLCIQLILSACTLRTKGEPIITRVEPHYGGLNGETKLTIYGSGFADDEDRILHPGNSNNGHGNKYGHYKSHPDKKVFLVSNTAVYECTVPTDGTLENQIVCYTPKGMRKDVYHLEVTVNGVPVNNSNYCNGNKNSWVCQYSISDAYTPLIRYIQPTSGPPGTILKIYGEIFTDKYGSNVDRSTNGREEKILRVYVGPQLCTLRDNDRDTDTLYGIHLTGTTGYLKCKMGGTSVGYMNASFIIDPPFGRSLPESATLKIFSDDNIAMFQAYTETTSINPTSVNTDGGQLLTIYGKYFDEHLPYTKARAYVGETECIVKTVKDTYLTCELAAKPSNLGFEFTGGRGLKLEYWNATQKTFETLEQIWNLSTSATDYHSGIADEAHFEDPNYNNFVSRLSGYFIPPHYGQYQFLLKCVGQAILYFSPTGPSSGKVRIASVPGERSSPRFTLTKGKSYYLDILHLNNGSDASVQVGAKFFNTSLTRAYSGNVEQERQRFRITSLVLDEIQSIDLRNYTKMAETMEVQDVEVFENTKGSFSDVRIRLGLFGVFTRPIAPKTASSKDVMTALNDLPWLDVAEFFTVESNISTNGVKYRITFNSSRGDFDEIEVRTVAGTPNVTVTVTEVTKGVSDMFTISLAMEGIPSGIFTSNATTDQVKAALAPMFGARCPKALTAPDKVKVAENFESGNGSSNGEWVISEAFCGRYSIKNPTVIYEKKDSQITGDVKRTLYKWVDIVCISQGSYLE